MSAMRDDNRRLTQTVSELRTDRRTQERKIRDLQRRLDLLRAQAVTAVMEGSMPSLPVEVATPPAPPPGSRAPRVVGMTDDGYEIVYEGDAAAGKVATLEDDPPQPILRRERPPARTTDRVTLTSRKPRLSTRSARRMTRDRGTTPSERSADAASEYRHAVAIVRSGNYDGAVVALRTFLGAHPRHDFADNAQYWLGEAYYAQKDYPQALTEFRNVIETYPRGNKVPDALLKVGYCYLSLGQGEKGRAVLEQVVNLYPKSEPAALAAKRLETP